MNSDPSPTETTQSKTYESLLPNDATVSKFDFRLLGLFLAGFSTFIDMYAPQPLLPMFRQLFHLSAATASSVISATTTAVALAGPFIGLLADRYGRKNIITFSIFLLTVPTMGAALSHSFGELVIWRTLQGVCLPGIIAVTMAYISEEWGKGAGIPMSWYISGTVLGGLSGRLVVGAVTSVADWRLSFVALGILNLIGGLVVWKALPKARNFVSQPDIMKGIRSMAGLFRNPALIATYVVAFSVLFCLVSVFNYMTFLLHDKPYNLKPGQISNVYLVYLVGVFITPLAGKMLVKYGSQKMLVLGLVVSAIGALITLVSPLYGIIIGLTICSSGIFICQATGSNRVGQVATGAKSTASGLYATFYYLGGSFGAQVGGIAWKGGGWPSVVSLVIGVQVLAAAMGLIFWRKRFLPKPQ